MSELARRLASAEPWSVVAERDLSFLALDGGRALVVACDSHGGIGPKPHDAVAVDASVLGRFALRVPLLEVVAAGATPRLVVDALSVERDPTGEGILDGVRAEALAAGLDPSTITGSTEENVPTVATGVGVTVIGDVRLDELRVGVARPPFEVVLLGRPMSAPAAVFGPDHPDIVTVARLVTALSIHGVVEALPIGSGGVGHEFEALAETARGRPEMHDDWPCDRDQSGGPSTAALLAVKPDRLAEVLHRVTDTGCPTWHLGRVV